MGMRVRLGPVSLSSSGRVGVRAGPVSIYGGGRRRRSSGGGFGALVGILFLVGLVVAYWYIALPVALVSAVIAYLVHRNDQRRLVEAQEAHAAQQQAWLAAPPPPLALPTRFTERWFENNVPYLHPGQVPRLMDELRARGWKDDRIQQRVGLFLGRNKYL